TLNNIGRVYDALGEPQKALEFYNQALPLFRAVGDRAGEATTLNNTAFLEKGRGNLELALKNIEAAVSIWEDLRTKVDSSELRASFFATVQDQYEFYIDLLMELHQQNPGQGFNAQALHISERSKARTLLELLQEANADIREGIDPQLLAEERLLQQKLDTLEKQRLQLFSQGEPTESQKINIQQEQKQLTEDYQELRTRIRAASPKYAALTQPEPLTLEQIQQQVLDEETVLLQYALGEERSYLWVVGKNSFASYKLPSQTEIAAAVRNFSLALNDSRATASAELRAANTAKELSGLILKPVANQLNGQLKGKRLLIVADGALQYIPFAALAEPGSSEYQPLILNHEIVNSPSASTIATIRQETQNRQRAQKTVAILADPVFGTEDERVTSKKTVDPETLPIDAQQISRAAKERGISWKRLPGTRQEAEIILGLVPEAERTHVFDFEANRTWTTETNLTDYQIVHLATHGFFDGTNPALSGIVLSLVDQQGNWRNGYLRLNEIFNLKLSAELVVLSACETALGENIQGEGLVGITRGFMYAGSLRVMATLWQVNDAGTAELISRFYQKLLSDRASGQTSEQLTPAAALRSAQIEMWQSQEWRSPHFWAAFTLQGEWRSENSSENDTALP
ncbi:MAG: CHAT domain-containing protein, partial [Oscillatoriales cyanobacterium RM2_1_1]|nr:CHAT domain-containing protein [Oscillatoriales cyanobacterium RM2_1_1]